jgi:hypothetical protein
MAISKFLQTFGIFYDHLVHFVSIGYIFSGFGIMYQEKSGNPTIPYHGAVEQGMFSNIKKCVLNRAGPIFCIFILD